MGHAFPMWSVPIILLVLCSLLLLILHIRHRHQSYSEKTQLSFVTRLRAKLKRHQ
jgi:hypothetical protein